MKNVLFLCTGNSCRSQMAEGFAKSLKAQAFNFFSAGTKKHGLNHRAVQVMQEVGVDITVQFSKTVEELPDTPMDYVFTVCSSAHESCPFFPGGKRLHVGFDDPPTLTQELKDEQEILNVYRRVRDEIKDFILNLERYIIDKSND